MKLVQIEKKDKLILQRLMQLYLHDISYYFPIQFDEDNALYIYDDLEKYFYDLNNAGYFITYNNNIAGFILIKTNNNSHIIQEIFVLNRFKNKRIGKSAVFDVFDKYKGNWTIKSLPGSSLAENFWSKTIKEYTDNNFVVKHIGKYKRAVYTFKN